MWMDTKQNFFGSRSGEEAIVHDLKTLATKIRQFDGASQQILELLADDLDEVISRLVNNNMRSW